MAHRTEQGKVAAAEARYWVYGVGWRGRTFATAGDNTAAGGEKVLPLSCDAKREKDRGGRGKVGKSSCIDDDERRRRHSFVLGKVNPNGIIIFFPGVLFRTNVKSCDTLDPQSSSLPFLPNPHSSSSWPGVRGRGDGGFLRPLFGIPSVGNAASLSSPPPSPPPFPGSTLACVSLFRNGIHPTYYIESPVRTLVFPT